MGQMMEAVSFILIFEVRISSYFEKPFDFLKSKIIASFYDLNKWNLVLVIAFIDRALVFSQKTHERKLAVSGSIQNGKGFITIFDVSIEPIFQEVL